MPTLQVAFDNTNKNALVFVTGSNEEICTPDAEPQN
jgi:hypothetical protein